MKKNSENLILPLIHTLIIFIAWLSPFWLDWKLILLVYILYTIQMIVFKGCILTNWQISKSIRKENNMTMYAFWIEKFGGKTNRNRLRFWSRWIMPLILLIASLIWQILLNNPVFIKI